MKKVGALWLRKSGKGLQYFSGILDGNELPDGDKINVVVFKNDRAAKESSPTHIMYLSEPKGGGRGTGKDTSQSDFFGGDHGPEINDDEPF